ncbi:uncharacterized protein LOC144638509 isoform X1 [Oculina patagonica]
MSRLEKESPFHGVASTSQEVLKEEKPSLSYDGRLKVTLLSSEWKSSKGGLSTINRELAIQLAKQRSVEVSVYLPKCSEEDKKVASSHNVQLIEAEELPGFEPIDWLFSLPKNHSPHCIIGHGVHLGRQIPLIKRHHHDCKWIQVVHTAPEELGMYKSYEEAIFKGEQKHQAEVRLCELADQVVAVGPKLADVYSRYLRFSQKDQGVLNLTPSIFTEFNSVKQATEERRKFCVLVFGRGDNEDFKLKGYDIAVQAVAELKDASYQLLFVGAPAGKEDEVAERLLQYGIPPSQLTVRRFNESREVLAKLFCEVDLAIMPSRTEGFGLTALEALSAGLPVLVSGNSGLGDALKKVPSGSYCVVDSEDPREWVRAIKSVREKEREVRLEEVKFLCEKYAEKYSWQKQCDCLVEKMLNLTFGSFSSGQLSAAVESSPSLSHSACPRPGEGVTVHQEGFVATGHSSTVECIEPLPSHEPFRSTEEPSDLGVHQKGSLEGREGSTEKGKRWLSLSGTQSSDQPKGSGHRLFRTLLEEEYMRRSNLKPLLWESTIHLPLDEVYTRLEVKWRRKGTFQLTDREIHMYEIFNLGEPDGKSSLFQRLRNKFGKGTQEKARMVLVEGSPGIGKTTFCLKIANDWARKTIPKKHDFPVFKLMLLLKCRDMEGDVMQAINDQLLPEDMTEKKRKDLMDYIRDDQNQDKILIILDGLDELPELAEPFVEKLLRRKVLSHCSVLATLRQEKGIQTRQRYDFDSLLQINGFTVEDASEYIRKHFKIIDDSEDLLKGESLIQAIKENIFLHALRNNPLNLLLLCVVFEDFEGHLPSNRSELYQIIFRCLLRRFCSKNKLEAPCDDKALENQFEGSTLVLGELAWRCLQEERPSFLEEELEKLEKMRTNCRGFPAVKLGFVFMEASVKKLNPRHEYHFVHRTFQEFLAAAYLAVKMTKEEINIFDYFQLDKRDITRKYRQVFLFVAGILGKDGAMFFKQLGEILCRKWNWQSPEEVCTLLIELLNESRAADKLAMVVCPCIQLPQSLELSLKDWHTLRFVRYAHEASSLEKNLAPVQLTKLSLTEERETLTKDSASDIHCILHNNKTLKDLFISTNDMTGLLASTVLKDLTSCLSLSSLTLRTFESFPPGVAVTFGGSLSSCNSLSTVTLKLMNESNDDWARAVTIGVSGNTHLKSIILEFYGFVSSKAVQALKLLLNTPLISLSLIVLGNMEDCLASALSEVLSGQTAVESLTVIVHGSLSIFGADLLVKGLQENITLHSLTFKVFGDVPEHWIAVVKKIYALEVNTTWKSVVLHPNVQGTFANASISLLNSISKANLAEKTLTINMWGELSICDAEALGDHLLKTSPLSSLILNAHGKVSNDVADYLVKFFVAYKNLPSLTINVWGEITSYGRSSLTRLRTEDQKQSFVLNVHGLMTGDGVCSSVKNCSTSTALSVDITCTEPDKLRKLLSGSKSLTQLCLTAHNHTDRYRVLRVHNNADGRGDWGLVLREGLVENNSLTALCLTVHNYADTREDWGHGLGIGLAKNKALTTFSLAVHNHADTTGKWGYGLGDCLADNESLTTFSLTVHNYSDTRGDWGHGLGFGLAENKSLTAFSLTVQNYADTGGDWGQGLGNALAVNKSLTTFSLTVDDHADTRGDWGYVLGDGLAVNSSLTTFSLTVHNYADTGEDWAHDLGKALAENKSLTALNLTVHIYADTGGNWGHMLDEGLAENKSLTAFSLTVQNYADTGGDWGQGLGNALAVNKSLTTFSLTVDDHADTRGDWGYVLGDGLAVNSSLTTFSLTVHNYADTGEDWAHDLGKALAENKSLTALNLTVHIYADTGGNWGHMLGEGLAEIKSLTKFSLTVHNYADTSEEWGHDLAEGLAKSGSLATLRLSVNNHSSRNRDREYDLFQRFTEIKSLTSLSVSVSLYGEDNVYYNNS